MTNESLLCPRCGSNDLFPHGKAQSGRQRYTCRSCRFRTTNPARIHEDPTFSSDIPHAQVYVITAAQNATSVHEPFLHALHQFCAHRDAELIVIPMRYRNPTSPWEDTVDDGWWDSRVARDLVSAHADLARDLTLVGDLNIQLTAASPLSGLDSLTGHKSGIFAHPKRELRSVATPQNKLPKLLCTTGMCTQPNFSQSKAGKKAEFHYTLGALVVELEQNSDRFHLRQVTANRDGSFIDLNTQYTPEGWKEAPPSECLVLGDIHAGVTDPKVLDATFYAQDSLARILAPKTVVWHDAFDHHARNHHEINDPFSMYARHTSGTSSVRDEIEMTARLIQDIDAACIWRPTHVFPFSNHPDALRRWIVQENWKDDPENMRFYLQSALAMLDQTETSERVHPMPDPFSHWMQELLPTAVRERCSFLAPDQSCVVKNIEVGSHGHLGPNGARGSIQNLSKIGIKTITGHVHSPGIKEGAWAVGTSTHLRLGYNLGPSSWMQSSALIYADGHRSLINIIDGRYSSLQL